jgi:Spy/CpxP family protein refolding chaperone
MTAEEEAAYTKTITQRAAKIVATIGLSDSSKFYKVRNIIADQYRNLNKIHTKRDNELSALKKQLSNDKTALELKVKEVEEVAFKDLKKLHKKYLSKLSKKLTAEQVDKVKDGMTYDVLHVTYNGYNNMIPNLTAEQKKKIMTWLIEARELAMDAESSDKKHATFGKYKGRINNYLSAAGYDLKKEGEEWEKRLKSAKAKTN